MIITRLQPHDLDYPTRLAKTETDALGFLPFNSLRYYAQQRGIWVIHDTVTTDPCGFAVFTRSKMTNPDESHIYQICTDKDHRRAGYGSFLLKQVMLACKSCGAQRIAAWVANDLPAIHFWHSCGFAVAGQREGGKRRKRTHTLFTQDLR